MMTITVNSVVLPQSGDPDRSAAHGAKPMRCTRQTGARQCSKMAVPGHTKCQKHLTEATRTRESHQKH